MEARTKEAVIASLMAPVYFVATLVFLYGVITLSLGMQHSNTQDILKGITIITIYGVSSWLINKRANKNLQNILSYSFYLAAITFAIMFIYVGWYAKK